MDIEQNEDICADSICTKVQQAVAQIKCKIEMSRINGKV